MSLNYIKQLGLKDTLCKRERPARLDFPTNISLVSPMSTWKGEGFYVEFFYMCLPLGIGVENVKGYEYPDIYRDLDV